MADPRPPHGSDGPPTPAAGLCNRCRHQRLVPNTRGSVFSLCELSKTDERFPRYPRLPILSCTGFEPEERLG